MPKKGKVAELEAPMVVAALQPGMVVRLKSGGPKMTVKSQADPEADVWCLWFDGNTLQTECFGVYTLVSVEEGKKKKSKV